MTHEHRPRAVSAARLVALAVIQGTIGIAALYGFSVLLPAFQDDPAVGPGAAGWVPWVAQAGLLAGFLGWQLMPSAGDPRTSAWLMALLAAALAAGSVAPTIGWLLAPVAVAGAGSLVYSSLQALINELAGSANVVQWLGAVMLTWRPRVRSSSCPSTGASSS